VASDAAILQQRLHRLFRGLRSGRQEPKTLEHQPTGGIGIAARQNRGGSFSSIVTGIMRMAGLSKRCTRHGRIDDISDLETMDITAFSGGTNPYGEGDGFAAGGFSLGREMFRETVATWGYSNLKSVADVGCGYGRWSMFLAEANELVSGYDNNSKCIRLARKLAQYFALENASFHTATATAIPAPDESFDGVWCFNAMSFFDRGQTLREMHRILRPDGRLFIGHYYSTGMMLETFVTSYRRRGLKHPGTQFALAGLIAGPFFDGRGNYGSPQHMEKVLERHGFELCMQPPMRIFVDETRRSLAPVFLGDFKDPSALAVRLAEDEELVKLLVSKPDAVSIYPMHIDLVAIKR
jgi:SAM-dependent methyltransferase